MSFLSTLFREPNDFRGKPYAYLTNQVGHIFLGASLPIYFIFAIYKTISVYPNQTWIALFLIAAYFCLWELSIQGWRGWDTVFDTFFFAVGASLYLFVEMDIVLDRVVTWLSALALALFVSTYRQYRIGLNE